MTQESQEFKGKELLALTKEIDKLEDDETKKLAKKYMKKLIEEVE